MRSRSALPKNKVESVYQNSTKFNYSPHAQNNISRNSKICFNFSS